MVEFNALLKLKRYFKREVVISRVSDLLLTGFSQNDLAGEFLKIDHEVWNGVTEDSRFLRTREIVIENFRNCGETMLCAFESGRITATLTWMRTTEKDALAQTSWFEKTGAGTLKTNNPQGATAFGVDLSVLKTASKNVSDRIVITALLIGLLGEGLKSIYLGSRIPGYCKHQNVTVDEYVHGKRSSGKPFDPELYFYLKNGFKIAGIIPDYMDDPKSLNYGVMVRWDNPLYKLTKIFPSLKYLIRKLGEKFLLGLPDIK